MTGKACPGIETETVDVCYGRGSCFDDLHARKEKPKQISARGNGSCACNDISFSGYDEEGRSTCSEGHCPPGMEEILGNCTLCPAGSSSVEGASCTDCSAGQFSPKAGGTCDSCPPGEISSEPGASACNPCPAGKFEDKNQYCRYLDDLYHLAAKDQPHRGKSVGSSTSKKWPSWR